MAQPFIVAPFAPANRSRAYLARNGVNTSSHQKRKPTARDVRKLAKQQASAAPVPGRISAGRVGKAKIGGKRRKVRRPMRNEGNGEDRERHNTKDATTGDRSSEGSEGSTPNTQPEPTAAPKVFGIFELREMVVKATNSRSLPHTGRQQSFQRNH